MEVLTWSQDLWQFLKHHHTCIQYIASVCALTVAVLHISMQLCQDVSTASHKHSCVVWLSLELLASTLTHYVISSVYNVARLLSDVCHAALLCIELQPVFRVNHVRCMDTECTRSFYPVSTCPLSVNSVKQLPNLSRVCVVTHCLHCSWRASATSSCF